MKRMMQMRLFCIIVATLSLSNIYVNGYYTSFVPRTLTQRQLEPSNTAFTLPTSSPPTATNKNSITMRVGKNSGRSKRLSDQGDGKLGIQNRLKMAHAGRPGTRRFVDPCKVFLGNVPFDADEDDVKVFLKQFMGTVDHVYRVKVIRDWKTHTSKGYAFVIFTDPIFATCAVEYCNDQKMMGRKITVDQGKKRLEPIIYVKKTNAEPATEEDAAIQSGLEEAQGRDAMEADFEAILQAQQDLDTEDENDESQIIADDLQQDDALLFGNDQTLMNDDNFEFDGDFETQYPKEPFNATLPDTSDDQQQTTHKLNRQQRREQQKGKKRSLPFLGFADDD